MSACQHPDHDHDGYDGALGIPTGYPMVCADCGAPTHYDSAVEDYVHDDPSAPPCFLIQSRPDGATPCTTTEGNDR